MSWRRKPAPPSDNKGRLHTVLTAGQEQKNRFAPTAPVTPAPPAPVKTGAPLTRDGPREQQLAAERAKVAEYMHECVNG